jgi:hypothetical protein
MRVPNEGRARLTSLDLGGDGDEVTVIENVEDAFGVMLDISDAPTWVTVGDVWASLLKELPEGAAGDPEIWQRFQTAIALETGVNPMGVARETELLGPGLIESIRQWLRHRMQGGV